MSEFDFLEPIPKTLVSIKLPSRGVLYPKDHPASGGKLTLSPMTMLEETLFTNSTDLSKTIDKVLQKCLQEKVDINSLLGADKFFLFMLLRSISYGSEYNFEWVCSSVKKGKPCDAKNTAKVHIPDDFKIKYLADDDLEPFHVTLPETKKKISFRLLRGYDEPLIDQHEKEIEGKRNANVECADTTPAFRLVRHIVAVDDKSVEKAPVDRMLTFVLSLPPKDRLTLQKKIAFYSPGLDTDLDVVCARCGSRTTLDMPFTANFFRTDDDTDDEGDTVDHQV